MKEAWCKRAANSGCHSGRSPSAWRSGGESSPASSAHARCTTGHHTSKCSACPPSSPQRGH
eukprot:8546319-Alexandrium_andersonii.AAC.1